MYIRSRDEALAAMSEILELPERPAQIVQATVKVALCLNAEARGLMLDVQAAIIEGGLDALRRRREEALARLTETKIRRHAPGVDVRNDALLKEVGAALDLLRMVRILLDVFPRAGERHPQWELARFVHQNSSFVRESIEAGLRRRGRPEHAPLEAKVLERIEERRPWWPEWAESIRHACRHYFQRASAPTGETHPGANDPELLFHVIVIDDDRAREVLRRMTQTGSALLDYLAQVRARIDLVLTAQQEASA
jgi:hypothetical protein